jgi:hypothetical protein
MKDNSNRVVTLVLLAWLCFAVGLASWFQNANALGVAATVWTLTALVLLACWKVRTIRASVLNVDLRWLVSLHLTRLFAGAYFLVLCQRGQLPCAFATPAGWGDIGIGVLAVAVVSVMRPTQFAKLFLLSWNTLGLIDIVLSSRAPSGLAYKTGSRCTRCVNFRLVFSRRFWCHLLFLHMY